MAANKTNQNTPSNISMAGTKGLEKARLDEYLAWANGQVKSGVETAINYRLFKRAEKAQLDAIVAVETAKVAKVAAEVSAETTAAQVAGFVAVFSQGLGITVPAEMQAATATALSEAGYSVATKQHQSGNIKFTANGGRRRSRSEYEAIIAALHAGGTQQGKSSRVRGVSRPEYLAIVGNTSDFLACGWSASAGNGLVKAARRLGFSVAFNKGETKAGDTLVLTAPAKKSASKAS